MGGPRAFGGGPLVGDSWVRMLYLDQSGIGKIQHDPILVVAGIIVHADSQWVPVARKLDELLADATPAGAKKPRFFHAKDVFHGSGEFPREQWDMKRRNDLLDAVGSLVEEFRLPVVWIGVDREEFAAAHPDESPADHLRDCYTTAAIGCFMQAELYLRQEHLTGEVCSILMEENKELQKRIPEMMAFMRDPGEEAEHLLPNWKMVMPLSKLIDTPACQPKTGSSILQLADYCAFAIKRRLESKPGSRRLTHPIAAHIMRYETGQMKGPFNEVYWNPLHMPSAWSFPIALKGRKFVRADKQLR